MIPDPQFPSPQFLEEGFLISFHSEDVSFQLANADACKTVDQVSY